jgi:hypothetical protein
MTESKSLTNLRIEIALCIISDHNGIKLELNPEYTTENL